MKEIELLKKLEKKYLNQLMEELDVEEEDYESFKEDNSILFTLNIEDNQLRLTVQDGAEMDHLDDVCGNSLIECLNKLLAGE